MKEYKGEKAIISLTSWKARINTVGLTIYSLLANCPGFHIVLVLSEEEFPQKEAELPRDIQLLSKMNKIEILWVYKNYKAFKKIIFTMDKYRDVPVISADDDCVYLCNYAQFYYTIWQDSKCDVVTNYPNVKLGSYQFPNGYATLYAPYVLETDAIAKLNDDVIRTNNDDSYYCYLLHSKLACFKYLRHAGIAKFHDEIGALGASGSYVRGDAAMETMIAIMQSQN